MPNDESKILKDLGFVCLRFELGYVCASRLLVWFRQIVGFEMGCIFFCFDSMWCFWFKVRLQQVYEVFGG